MRTIKSLLCFAVAAVVSVSSSQAQEVVLTSPDGFYNLTIDTPTAVGDGSEDLVSVLLSVVSLRPGDALANASSFDGSIGTNGTLHHQRLFGGNVPTPTTGSFGAVSQPVSPIDSHFTNNSIALTDPSEGGTGTPSTEAPAADTAFGFSLDGNFALLTQEVTSELAQLVVADGSDVTVDFTIGNGIIGATPALFQGTFQIGGGGGMDPVFTGPDGILPNDGTGTVDLQSAWDNLTDLIENAITVANTSIESVSVDNPVFTAEINGTNPAGIDLGIDRDVAVGFPPGIQTGIVTVVTPDGDFTFGVTANVPEPSTYAMLGMALVGFVGYIRRRK